MLLSFAALLMTAPTAKAQAPRQIATINRATPVSFEEEILPIFRKNCLACHSSSEAYAELVLETAQTIIKGGDSGPAAVPGKGADSLLLKVAAHQIEPVMPPEDNDVAASPLTPQELALLKLWIDQGAKGAALSGVISPQQWRPLPPGTHPIYAVAVTPDGQYAACGRANQIFIYHVPTGQLVTRLTDPQLQAAGQDKRPGIAHLDVVQSLAFSPQGDLLASGGFRTVKLWRYPRDVQRLTLQVGEQAVTTVAVSPDRKWLATGAADNSIKLWDLETGQASRTLTGHEAAVTSLRYSASGDQLYSASADRTIRVWNVSDGSLAGRIDSPTEIAALTTVILPQPPAENEPQAAAEPPAAADAQPAAAPAGGDEPIEPPAPVIEWLASGGGDNSIRLWRVPSSLPTPLVNVASDTRVLAAASDGSLLAMAGDQGGVQLIDPATGTIVKTIPAHEGPIHDVAFWLAPEPDMAEVATAASDTAEADGKPQAEPSSSRPLWLATAGDDHSVRVFDCRSGEAVAMLQGSLVPIQSVAFHPDGKTLVAGAADGQVTVWNLAAAASRAIGDSSGGPATVSAVSPDAALLATSGMSAGRPAIVVYDVASGQLKQTLLGHAAPITALAFSADGSRLISGSEDKTARVWDLKDAKFPQLSQFAGHAAAVTSVAFSPDGQQALCGSAAGSLRIWNTADGSELADLAGHTVAIVAVAMPAAGQAVSASADKTIRFWSTAGGAAQRTITEPAAVTAVTVSRDGTRIAVALDDKTVRLHQTTDGAVLQTLAGHVQPAGVLSFSVDGTRLLTGDAGSAMVWNTADGRLLEIIPVAAGLTTAAYGPASDAVLLGSRDGVIAQHALRFSLALTGMTQAVTSVAFHPGGETIYTSSADGTVRAFSRANGQQLFAANHGAAVHDLALSPDGAQLASAGEDKSIKRWNTSGGAPLQPPQLTGFQSPVRGVCFSADGTRLVGAGGNEAGELLVFNLAEAGAPEQSLVGQTGPVTSLVTSQALGDRVFAAGGGAVVPWHLLGIRSMTGHTQPVTSLAAISTEAMQILSGSSDGTVRRWNVETGQAISQLNHGGPVTAVAVQPDGQRFASASANNSAKLWNAAGTQLAEMRGDLRAQKLVAKLTQEKTNATQKVAAAKTALEAVEKDLPLKTDAEKKAAEALAATTKDVDAKSTALAMASTTKASAEKVAIEAAAAAQRAAQEMERAKQLAADLADKARMLADKAAQARALAATDTNNPALTQAAAAASMTAGAAEAEAKAAESAMNAPTTAAASAAQAAADAATKALAMSKPYTDAATALEQAQSALRAAQQADEIAKRELADATAAVPAARNELAAVEAALTKIDTDLTAATAAQTAAQQPLRTLAFSPDGRTLATGGDFGVVHTWDAETGKAVSSYVGHAGPIQSLVYITSDELASASIDKSAVVWELNPRWQLERVIGDISDPSTLIDRVAAVDISPDGQRLVTGGGVPSRSGEVKIFDINDGTILQSIPEAHTDAINAVAFSPDGTQVASAGSDKYVKTFDVATGQQRIQFEGHTNHVLGVSWRAGGQMLASCGADATIRFWNAATGDRIRSIENYTKQITAIRFVGQTQFTVSSSGDRIVRMHNSDNGGVQRDFPGSADYMYSVDVTPDSAVVIAGGHDSVLRIWSGTNGQVLQTIEPPSEPSDSTRP